MSTSWEIVRSILSAGTELNPHAWLVIRDTQPAEWLYNKFVITIGGLHGTVSRADDKTVSIEVSPGVELTFERAAIARVEQPALATEPDTSADEPVSPIQETKKTV